MEIWTSFEAKFTPFPRNIAAEEVDDFLEKLAEIVYDPDFAVDCSVSVCERVYSFTTDGDTNPKEFVPAIANVIAGLGGQGDITTQYVTSIMEVS